MLLLDQGQPPVWQPGDIPGRVSALNLSTRYLLEHIDVWDAIVAQRAMPYRRMRVWDSHSGARIEFDAAEESVPALGYIVENNLVAGVMHDRLRQNYQVTLKHGQRVTDLVLSDPETGVPTVGKLQELDVGWAV